MESLTSLKLVKEKISSLDPINSSALELQFYMQNAIEIMIHNKIDIDTIGKLTHTYNKELSYTLSEHVVKERIDFFKQTQDRCQSEIPEEDFYIETIPESWSTPPASRYDLLYLRDS